MVPRRWLSVPPPCSPCERRWLTLPGSLTQALRGCGHFSLSVISEGWERLPVDERDLLHLPAASTGWVRRVVMSLDGIACVAARTTTTHRGVCNAWQRLARRGTRPLGELLYHDGSIQRGDFRFLRQATLPESITAPSQHPQVRCLSRRSLFIRNSQPLLVTECFLAGFLQRKMANPQPSLPPRWSPLGTLADAH